MQEVVIGEADVPAVDIPARRPQAGVAATVRDVAEWIYTQPILLHAAEIARGPGDAVIANVAANRQTSAPIGKSELTLVVVVGRHTVVIKKSFRCFEGSIQRKIDTYVDGARKDVDTLVEGCVDVDSANGFVVPIDKTRREKAETLVRIPGNPAAESAVLRGIVIAIVDDELSCRLYDRVVDFNLVVRGTKGQVEIVKERLLPGEAGRP